MEELPYQGRTGRGETGVERTSRCATTVISTCRLSLREPTTSTLGQMIPTSSLWIPWTGRLPRSTIVARRTRQPLLPLPPRGSSRSTTSSVSRAEEIGSISGSAAPELPGSWQLATPVPAVRQSTPSGSSLRILTGMSSPTRGRSRGTTLTTSPSSPGLVTLTTMAPPIWRSSMPAPIPPMTTPMEMAFQMVLRPGPGPLWTPPIPAPTPLIPIPTVMD